MKLARAGALIAGVALGASLCVSAVSAQTESASAEDGAPASDAPAETTTTADAPLGANLTPSLGALPLGPTIISGPGSGLPGSSSVSMAPGTLTAGVAREGENAVRAPEAAPPPAPAPAPVTEAAPEPVAGTTGTATADRAVATETDLDADNYADALEWDLGLDPADADTDDDGLADGDELNIYGTSPTTFDTDGDGPSDGEEIFGIFTDPLVWEDHAATGGSDTAAEQTAAQALE